MLLNFVLICFILNASDGHIACQLNGIIDKCKMTKSSAHNCLQVHFCCHWCYQKDFTFSKCDTKSNLRENGCNDTYIENNFDSEAKPIEDKEFKTFEGDKTRQFRPQHFQVNLWKNHPVNLTIKYKPVEDYPLDLYYLLDISLSMRDHLSSFKNITPNLTQLLGNLTKNFKVAYGSFIDKIGMPFYLMDKRHFENPCLYNVDSTMEQCNQGYTFRHHLNFTNDTNMFTEEVLASKLSSNLDNVDGALEAIMQVLVCRQFAWAESSRKIILVITESILHMAGDGILLGNVLRHPEKCRVDPSGLYIDDGSDYPSLYQIEYQLRKNKVKVIFATKTEQYLDYYKRMKELMPDFVDARQMKTHNEASILDVIKESYELVSRNVKMFINTSECNYFDVDYFVNCDGTVKKGSSCNMVTLGNTYEFTFQFNMKKVPHLDGCQLSIEEKVLNERVAVDLKFMGFGVCANMEDDNATQSCVHGVLKCGFCLCLEGWTGENCDEECVYNIQSCIQPNAGSICSSRGNCRCSKCDCDFPYNGTFCEYKCPVSKSKTICNGFDCVEGKCICLDPFTEKDCSCKNSTENCKAPTTDRVCSDHGACICNECKCDKGFNGQFCEESEVINEVCDSIAPYIKLVEPNKSYQINLTCTAINISNEIESCKTSDCKALGMVCTATDSLANGQVCVRKFSYMSSDLGLNVIVFHEYCTMSASINYISAGIALLIVLLIGLLFIFLHKRRLKRLYLKEVELFRKHRKAEAVFGNPIYENVEMQYRNPLYKKNEYAKMK